MTCEEFALHQAYWAREPSGPEGEILRWAALMAATANGLLVKRSKQRFTARDFWPGDVWAPRPEDMPAPKDGKGGKRPRMAPDFSHLRGMKVANRKR